MSSKQSAGMRRGPMGHGRGPAEKAKDFRGTMAKLIRYLGSYRINIIIAFLFSIFSVALMVIGPKILGNATGISSFWVVVAILVGGGFGGVLGMFLGVPVFACIQVLVKHLVDQRLRRRNMPTEAYHYVDRDQPPKPPAPSA